MNAKHTPGPWISESVVEGVWPDAGTYIYDTTQGIVAQAEAHTTPETTLANARLIAAAPDLLHEAEETAHWLRANVDWLHERGERDGSLAALAVAAHARLECLDLAIREAMGEECD